MLLTGINSHLLASSARHQALDYKPSASLISTSLDWDTPRQTLPVRHGDSRCGCCNHDEVLLYDGAVNARS